MSYLDLPIEIWAMIVKLSGNYNCVSFVNKFFHEVFTLLRPALKQIDSEVYMEKITEHKYLSVSKWARANGCNWDSGLCANAAFTGRLDVLIWLRDKSIHGDDICPWDGYTCMYAAINGHLDVIKWSRDKSIHGDDICKCGTGVCYNAAINGHLDVLKWAAENDCPLDDFTVSYVADEYRLNLSHLLK